MLGKNVDKAIHYLNQDNLVAIPTETVYGLAGNALQNKVIANIFSVKNRPFFNPLIVHVSNNQEIEKYASDISEMAYRLSEVFMPGPLTIVLKKKKIISDLLTSGNDTVAIRVPSHKLTQKLLSKLNFPLAAPSANPFGFISPTSAQHVLNMLGNRIPYILDGGHSELGVESTIVSCFNNQLEILRLGSLTIEEIENVINQRVQLIKKHEPKKMFPGMMSSHYSPSTKMILCDIKKEIKKHDHKRIAVLSFSSVFSSIPMKNQVQLSKGEDSLEAAANLFASMHYLDSLKLDAILAEKVPNRGVGRAINDRLIRASI